MARSWTVTWKGERGRQAREVLDMVKGGPFLCGEAVWTCAGADYGEPTIGTLIAYDPHDVNPAEALPEAPAPNEAR